MCSNFKLSGISVRQKEIFPFSNASHVIRDGCIVGGDDDDLSIVDGMEFCNVSITLPTCS